MPFNNCIAVQSIAIIFAALSYILLQRSCIKFFNNFAAGTSEIFQRIQNLDFIPRILHFHNKSFPSQIPGYITWSVNVGLKILRSHCITSKPTPLLLNIHKQVSAAPSNFPPFSTFLMKNFPDSKIICFCPFQIESKKFLQRVW